MNETIKDVTAYYTLQDTYRLQNPPSVFKNRKASDKVLKLMKPVLDAEYRLLFSIVNRLNILLYDYPEPLMFRFDQYEMKLFHDYKLWTVEGVRCKHDNKYLGHPGEGRSLMVMLHHKDRTKELNAMYLNSAEAVMLFEMVVRRLYPRGDNADGLADEIFHPIFMKLKEKGELDA